MTVHSPDLERKLLKRIDTGKGTQLSADEVRYLLQCGAMGKISEDAARVRSKQCLELNGPNPSTKGENSNSSPEKDGTSKSSGTIPPQGGKDALARGQQIFGPGR